MCLFQSHTASAGLSWDFHLDPSDVKTGTLPVDRVGRALLQRTGRAGGETGAQDPAIGTLKGAGITVSPPFFLLGWLRPPPLAPAHQHRLRAASCRGAPSQPGDHPQQHQEVREVGWTLPRALAAGVRQDHIPGPPSSPSVSLLFAFLSPPHLFGSPFLCYVLKNQCFWLLSAQTANLSPHLSF